ncbi:hypothetical protein Purlil1_3948 [Purpureocillium lilacinum]|uniref:Uncharacterized protein n=1 Tax=Purpureocillium lilacinum TaxID=33203 RepID=A0ABR0C6Z9_PURLI|nr:hypothetical protein Purlil1_3948 [Purpureocillium lilacinum]
MCAAAARARLLSFGPSSTGEQTLPAPRAKRWIAAPRDVLPAPGPSPISRAVAVAAGRQLLAKCLAKQPLSSLHPLRGGTSIAHTRIHAYTHAYEPAGRDFSTTRAPVRRLGSGLDRDIGLGASPPEPNVTGRPTCYSPFTWTRRAMATYVFLRWAASQLISN